MPQHYSDLVKEHVAARSACGLFDLSHLSKFSVRGKQAISWLNKTFAESIDLLQDGHTLKTHLFNRSGTIIDTVVLARAHRELFFVVGSASQHEADSDCLRSLLPLGGIGLSDDTAFWCALSLVGPESARVFQSVFTDIPYPPLKSFLRVKCAGDFLYLSRSGREDAHGIDIYCPSYRGIHWFEQLMTAGAVPCGMVVRRHLQKK